MILFFPRSLQVCVDHVTARYGGAEALAHFNILRPFLQDGVPLPRIAHEQDLSPRTLERWAARYRSEGLVGLARRRRADKGEHRIPDKLRLLIEGLALEKPRRSVASIRRRACEVAEREGWPDPGYKLVWSIVRGVDPALMTIAHEGEQAYRQAYDLIHRREASRPNEIWQADHTELDIRVLDDQGESVRPWLTVVLDDYSRAVAGYYLTFAAPSAIGTALALHQASVGSRPPQLLAIYGLPAHPFGRSFQPGRKPAQPRLQRLHVNHPQSGFRSLRMGDSRIE